MTDLTGPPNGDPPLHHQPVGEKLGEIVGECEAAGQRVDGREEEDVTELEPELHEVVMQGVQGLGQGVVAHWSCMGVLGKIHTPQFSWLNQLIL